MNFTTFHTLIEVAAKETAHLSVAAQRNKHVRQIIETTTADTIGFACLILEDHFHLALILLSELVPPAKHPPIPAYYAGRVPVIKACWQFWALHEGLVKIKYDPTAYWVEDRHGNRGNWH
jgi:hypothetical protein